MMKMFLAAVIGALGVLGVEAAGAASPPNAVAVLAGGCFWCLEHDFRQLPGVVAVVSGYSGGSRDDPNYGNYHDTDAANPVPHVEAVQVTYDPAKLTYDKVLDYYFRHVDPTDGGGQFCDRGPAYRPVLFIMDDAEQRAAEAKKIAVAKLIAQPVAVEIAKAAKFWPAEDYHQDYAEKNALQYKFYRWNCGRDQRVKQIWGKLPE